MVLRTLAVPRIPRPRRLRILIAAVPLVAVMLSPGSATTARAATVPAAGAYTITNVHSGLALDTQNASNAHGAAGVQATANSGPDQEWTLVPAGSGEYKIVNGATDWLLGISGESTSAGGDALVWDDNGTPDHLWTLVSQGGTEYKIQNVHSGLVLGVSGESTSSGAQVLQWTDNGTPDHLWNLTPLSGLAGLPAVESNSCENSSLPAAFGTNFPTPADPFGQGFSNESAIGWPGNYWPVFAYLSGSYFARGVPTTYNSSGTTLCGGMYSFSIYNTNGPRPAQSVQWTEDGGYLPALTTSFTTGTTAVSIKNFADEESIGGTPTMLVYTQVAVTNNGSSSISLDPGGTGLNLVRLTSSSLDTVAPGATSDHDYVAAVDNFSAGVPLPSAATLAAGAPSLSTAYSRMTSFWNSRLAVTPTLSLPNVTLPNTSSLTSPGTALDNAYKAGTIYGLIMQSGEAQFSAANNYAWLLNHDLPGMLIAHFENGDFTDAQNLLLTARISEATTFNEHGANWYFDGDWKTPAAWAIYLAKTGDTAFVGKYFHDDASGPSGWGPSLFTIMHTIYQGQLASNGVLKSSNDNDSQGSWLFDDYSALQALAAYKYIATVLGNTTEAEYANSAYNSLLSNLNTVLSANESANGFSFLPCTVNQPNSANRCNTFNDANWASPEWVNQNQWSTFLEGGTLSGIAGSATQGDALYAWGFARLAANGLPYPTFGAFNGYSTAYNTAYSSNGLYGTQYRDLPITSYAWQIATTTGGPSAWWEANGSGPSSGNPWIGNHAGPEFGACPYAWPISAQQQGLLEALVAEGLSSSGSGPFTFTRPLYIGRGIPNAWIAAGQTISVSNIASGYNVTTGARTTYGVSLAVTKPGTGRVITVSISGTPPAGTIAIQLPIFNTVAVTSVTGGTYNSGTQTVTAAAGATTITITLAS
jgi:ricin-type beta-trefoil lectin protein